MVLFTIIWWHSKISLNTALIYIPNYSPTFSFFLSFFLNLTSVYLLIIGVEGYFCTWLHSMIYIYIHTHTHTAGLLWTSDRPVAETSAWQRTTLTRDRHPWPPAGFEPAVQASERPQIHAWDWAATGIGQLHVSIPIRIIIRLLQKSYILKVKSAYYTILCYTLDHDEF